jgi:uncharacterized membrane protein YgdD (TMEM256/DUF423 family)
MEKELSNQESLQLITKMISEAKKNVSKGGSFQLLLWGWIISLSNLGHYFLELSGYLYPYIVWLSVIPAVIISAIHSYRMQNNSRVVTHLDKVYAQVWIAIFIAIIILLTFMYKIDFNHSPVILLLAGIGTYLTGVLLRFNPVKFGGIVLFVGSIVAFNLPVSEQYLAAGIFIIIGYLVPGYLLKRAEK